MYINMKIYEGGLNDGQFLIVNENIYENVRFQSLKQCGTIIEIGRKK